MTLLCFLLLIASYANGQSDTKSSLTFVIDVTRSMRSVKNQVEAHAQGIFDAVVRSHESDIENFVLVTFADPEALKTSVNNVTSTKDPDIFKDALSLVLVSGVDCPEYSMSGITTGIENSKPGSTIYVFTDASAKDYEAYKHVKDMALKKEITIIFVLTGSCPKSSKNGYDVYTWLANDTSGQVFNLHKHNVSHILNWIKYSVVSRRILLKAKSFSPGDVLFLNYTTDLATRETTISLSGCNKSLVVTGPDGKKLELEDLVHLENILVVKVNENKPGTHSVAFDCKNKTRLVVTAKSDIHFRHGFSGFVPTNLNDTTVKPSRDGKTYLSIKISGNFRPETVNFVDAYDNVVPGHSLPLQTLNETQKLYVTGPFDTRFSMIRIIVTGLDLDHNATISRIGYTFVEPQSYSYLDKIINKRPSIVIERSPKLVIEIGSFLQLKCTVNAFPKPNITWEKDGTILETNVYDYDLPYAYVSVHKMVNVNENSTFVCKAKNSEGEDKQTLLVEIKPKPIFEVVEKPENVTIKYNDLVHLKCKADAYPHANVTWYKKGVRLSKKDGITDDGSELMIQHMKLANEGKYSCNIKNDLQEEVIRFEIKISGLDTPKIVNTSDSQNFTEGTVNTIACKIEKGTPEPAIRWYFDNGLGKYDEIVEAIDDELLIMSKVKRNQAGKYKCTATNELGTDVLETNVIVEYPPTIDNDTNLVTADAGGKVVLTCSCDGVPAPNITWTRNGKQLAGSKFTFTSDRLIFEADMVDVGAYKCKASNRHGSSEKSVLLKVNKPPTSIILEGSSIVAEYDEPLTITCKIWAFPKPDIFWVNKSGKTEIKYIIEEKSLNNYVSYMDIDRVTTNDTYLCQTNNTLGSSKSEITVITAKKPYFNIRENPEDKNHNIKYNDIAQFVCKVEAYPPPEVNWYKDGGVLAKDDLSVSSNGSILTIKYMRRVDQGTYKCEANNSITRFSFPFKISISGLEKPKIQHAPLNINVNENTNTTINCRIIAGIPKPSIRWFHKENSSGYVEINEAKDSKYLILNNINRRDQGVYKCATNNSEGTDWMETNVIVEYMPTIDNDTGPIIAKAGEAVTLTCIADGVPKPIVKWTKDDLPLIGSKFTPNEHRHTIDDVGFTDAGVYKCNASNPHGSESKTINVEVHDKPITRIIEKDKLQADINEHLNITCKVIGFPKPDITWINTTDTSELKSKIEEITPYHFISRLNVVKVSSQTTFQCKASNSLGTTKDDIEIIVKHFFKDLQCPDDTTHDIGYNKTALFVCKVDAYPPAEVIWYRNGKVFPKEDLSVSSDGITLIIKHMQIVDQGRYKCVVKNSIRSSECPFAIRMSGVVKPKVFASLKTMNVVENSSAIIHCRIEIGTPKPSTKWYHNDIEIGRADREYLSFTNIKRGEQGNYKCIATNLAGNDTMETDIIVDYAPKMIEDVNLTLSFLVDSKVSLKCLADGVPKPTITWSKDDSPLNSLKFITNSDNSIEFDVGLEDRGTYKCVAVNYLGTAVKSVILEVDTPPAIFIEGDSKPRVDYDGFLQLKCYVHAHPAPDIRWTDTTRLKALSAPTFAIKPPYEYVSILNITRAVKNTTYQCEAENIHDKHKSSVIVEVGTKTYFNVIDEPRDTIISYQTQGHLYCNIDAYPPAKITWYKDLKEITSKNGLTISDGILTFKNMEPIQRGRYICEAKNSDITKTFGANVVVSGLESPKISKTSSEKRNHIREILVRDVNITMSCKIKKGIPKPSIKWMYKNKHTLKYVEIEDARDRETYSVAVCGDTLQYACEASNLVGFDSLKMNLKLPANRSIKRKGKKRRTLVGGKPNALKLECRVKITKDLPRPKIIWIYKGTNDNPKNELLSSEGSDKPRFHTSTFKTYNVTFEQGGLYSCVATDCFGIQSSDTFIVDVNTPPKILNRVKVLRAVVDDTAFSIHCNATGHPKPGFRWTHAGITTEGSDTLTLFNITPRHADFYERKAFFVCEAYNSVEVDSAMFQVIIDDYPSLDNPNSTLQLILDEDVSLVCPIPHRDSDLLRWYKNNKKLTDGELKIANAKMSDAGLYTCRVSGATDSTSANVELKVGSRLIFTNTDARGNVSLGVGEVVTLDCIALGIPNPRVSWFHNGKAISATALYHRFKMNNAKSGTYKCEVTNDFDTISRTFDVVLSECLIKINPNDRLQPLILTQRFTTPTFKYEDGFLYMPQNQSILATCGTDRTFNHFAYDYMTAYCNATVNLQIEGGYDFSDLKCNKEVTPYVKWTGKPCQGEDSEMIEIGYEIHTKTMAVYESCMDIVNDVPFYTKQSMSLPLTEVVPKVAWFEDRLKNDFEAMYDVDEQIDMMTSTLGFWFHKLDRCVFTQRQLVDPLGVFPGVPQWATFTHLNVVPQWGSCSTKNWDDVESRVRDLLKWTQELTVWTGTAEKLTLRDSYFNAQEIFLTDPKRGASPSPVSTYLWKVVQNRARNASLAIIQINVPDIKPSDLYSYIKCRDVCSRTDWMNSPEWSETSQGYVFCCTLDEFENTFGYRGRGIFGGDMYNPLLHV